MLQRYLTVTSISAKEHYFKQIHPEMNPLICVLVCFFIIMATSTANGSSGMSPVDGSRRHYLRSNTKNLHALAAFVGAQNGDVVIVSVFNRGFAEIAAVSRT